MQTLTNSQKDQLKKLYGVYQDANHKDFDSVAEYTNFKVEYREEILAFLKNVNITNVKVDDLPKLIYTDNQLLFIEDAKEAVNENEEINLYYSYSGRGMFGDVCPALYCDSIDDITTKAKKRMDNMGKGIVIYAQN